MTTTDDFRAAAAAVTAPANDNAAPAVSISPDKQLLDAVEKGDIEAARDALTAGASIDARDELQTTPLMIAVFAKNAAMVHFLLANKADVLAERSSEGALHLAARADVPEITETLLHHGAGAHLMLATKNNKMTPLHIAAMTGSEDAARQLMQAGAAVNYRGENYMSAVDVAAQAGNVDIIRMLVIDGQADLRGAREGQGFDPMYYAIAGKHIEAVKELLRLGSDPLKTDPDMPTLTPLGQAAAAGEAEIVKLFLALPDGTYNYERLGHALGQAELNQKAATIGLLEDAMRDYVIKNRPAPQAPAYDPGI
ncbi:MAG: delta-latroinsectotoxin-Lt1a-like [Alphaproteobacteria bacterium]|jgi:ankyrin repeat protein|nr:delta-latroinsectotoxin-Lt1a-like [Alphaproteobacteria bacterium]